MKCRWAAALVCVLPVLAWALPTPQQVRSSFVPSETRVLSREGQLLQRLRTDMQVRRGQWVALADVSPALRMALLVSEDQRFYAHSGVDWKAVSAAAWANVWNEKTRGASTITMQLAGLLDEDWRASNQGRSVGQKLGQALAATQLERSWRKDQILEAYLNLLPFRGELAGVDALSRTLFGKAPHGLDAVEAAITAALVRGPNAQASVVAQRACGVWQSLQAQQMLAAANTGADCTAVQWRTEQALRARLWPASEGIAPHWAQRVWAAARQQHLADALSSPASSSAPSALLQVRSTVSAPLQRLALQSVQRHLRELQGRNVEDAAAVVLDNASGEVLAWVGSSGSLSQAAEVDGVLAWRQPGSTLKPFLYAQAIAQKRLTVASLLEDSAAHIATPSGLYIPQNYDRRFKGWVSTRMALAASLNVPAVRTLVMVTPEAFFQQLQALGMPLRESAGFYGYSLALGSAEVPLLHLSNAYRALANGGQFSAVASPIAASQPSRAQGVQSSQALSPQAAFVVGSILADAQARVPTFGADSVLATRFWTAVKTGTSKDMRDNWAVGWSQHYTVGVWVGNASGAAMHGVSGSSGAAPIWADIMAGLHAQRGSQAPHPPPGVQRTNVRFDSRIPNQTLEPPRQEWFLAGTQQAVFTVDKRAASALSISNSDIFISESVDQSAQAAIKKDASVWHARIAQPVSGTVLALDPDIPPQHQRLQLRAHVQGPVGERRAPVRWILVTLRPQPARTDLGRGHALQWMPWPGQHRLELHDASGQLLDSIELQVRGAAARAQP